MSNLKHLLSFSSIRAGAKSAPLHFLILIVVYFVGASSLAAQIPLPGSQYDSGMRPDRTSGGAIAPPVAFSGVERPESGSFLMTEPLLSLPGRAGLDVELNLSYNSSLYQVNSYVYSTNQPRQTGNYVDATRSTYQDKNLKLGQELKTRVRPAILRFLVCADFISR